MCGTHLMATALKHYLILNVQSLHLFNEIIAFWRLIITLGFIGAAFVNNTFQKKKKLANC